MTAVLVVCAALAGCSRGRDAGPGDNGQVVDTELMAFLSEARSLHHEANIKEAANDLAGATTAMVRLVDARRPQAATSSPEVEEVLADAYARLAELRLRQNAVGPAAEAVASGLAHAPQPTYFRGHLLEVQGLIEESRANALADAGKLPEAVQAREKAIKLLEEVVRIQDDVIRRSLGGQDAGGSR
jgi:hypothetical protein